MEGFEVLERDTFLAVGRTDQQSTRFWFRDGGGRVRTLEITGPGGGALFRGPVPKTDAAADHTATAAYPNDFPNAPALFPGIGYRMRLLDRNGQALEAARFETSPAPGAAPERFAIGVASCHQPFDEDGRVSEKATRLLNVLVDALRSHGVKRMLLMGDQMYTDLPESRSLFDASYFETIAPSGRKSLLQCTREEVRRVLHQRHRTYWSVPGFQRLQSAFPCYPMLDDHEIADNFGTLEEHSNPEWQRVLGGALDAFHDYQACRMAPLDAAGTAFDYGWEYGPIASYVMDLRSEKRNVGDRIEMYGEAQLARLRDFLTEHGGAPVFMLVLTVPLAHVPDPAAHVAGALIPSGNDIQDRWSYPAVHHARKRLLDLLTQHRQRHPRQKLLLLGGDVHVGSVARVGGMVQLVSSALTNRESEMVNRAIALLPRFIGKLGKHDLDFELLPGVGGHDTNPVTTLNAGVVELIRREQEWDVVLRLLTADDDGNVCCKFESEPL